MLSKYKGTHFVVWINVRVDPHDKFRGFSILNKEFRVEGYSPIVDEMKDLSGQTMKGRFWVVKANEVYRVVPELKRFDDNGKAWFFPVEFCEAFVRPNDYLDYKVLDWEW